MYRLLALVLICVCCALPNSEAFGQTVKIDYLQPGFVTPEYNYVRFGTPAAYQGGFMHNKNTSKFGNGDDFTIYTYGDRDLSFSSGTGHIVLNGQLNPGNVGIGTVNPVAKLHVNGHTRITGVEGDSDSSGHLRFESGDAVAALRFGLKGGSTSYAWIQSHGSRPLRINELGNDVLMNINGGNVGIGTTSPSHKLSINGKVRAKEIIVDTNWSDFVFDEGYDLPTLEEVAAHIEQHGHLPAVPSAEDIAEHGVTVGAMQATLLQKIEELTLYAIEQHDHIEALQLHNAQLEARLQALEQH